jgi:hypothetical protein
MERLVKYSIQQVGYLSDDREKFLSVFLYEVPSVIAYNVFPPLHILNISLRNGRSGHGSHSPLFTWEPFEVSNQEYQELLPKLLNPDWEVIYEELWCYRLPMKLDSEFDHITDRYAWLDTVSQKYRKSVEETFEEYHQFLEERPSIRDKWYQYLNSRRL